jgi:hypothetical protein
VSGRPDSGAKIIEKTAFWHNDKFRIFRKKTPLVVGMYFHQPNRLYFNKSGSKREILAEIPLHCRERTVISPNGFH